MANLHVLEKLQASNPKAEIWWDSSPLVYATWAKGVLAKASPEKQAAWGAQLARLFDPAQPEKTLFRGVTTNPPLSLAAIKDDPAGWGKVVRGLIEEHPGQGVEEIYWLTYKQVVAKGAQFFRPIWE